MPAYLDIETEGQKADEGGVVAVGIWLRRPEVRLCLTKEQEKSALQWLARQLEEVDLLVTWFGSGFDLPFLMARASLLNVSLRSLRQIRHLDLCEWCRKNLLLSRYSLEHVAKFFGYRRRVPFQGADMSALIKQARRGDKRAADWIKEHCLEDLTLLRKIYRRLSKSLEL